MQAHCFDVAEVQLLSAGLSLEQELVPLEQREQAQLAGQARIYHEIDAVCIVERPAKTKLSACLMCGLCQLHSRAYRELECCEGTSDC